jgi:hypothetical protein
MPYKLKEFESMPRYEGKDGLVGALKAFYNKARTSIGFGAGADISTTTIKSDGDD